MTITLGDRTEIPLHPLDLTTPSLSDPSSSTCVGLIQQDFALENPNLGVGDMILGVPFFRNVYSVLAFNVSAGNANLANPSLGLLNITDPKIAMDEFNTVRVLNLPLDSTQTTSSGGGHKLAVGLEVLFGLGGFVVLCVVAFVARWYVVRRRMRKDGVVDMDKEGGLEREGEKKGLAAAMPLPSDEGHLEADGDLRPGWRGFGSISPSLDSQRTLLDGAASSRHSKHGSSSKIDPDAPSQVNIHVESDGEDSAGEMDGSLMKSYGRRRKEEEEAWRESWFDSYSAEQPALHGEWRPDSGSSPRPSLRELRLSSSDRRASNFSSTSSSAGLIHTPPHTPTMPLLPLESRLDASLRGSTVESLSDYAIGLPPPSTEFGLLGSRRGSIADTMLGISATAPSRPRLHGHTSSGLRSSSMTNVISASDVESHEDSTPHAL